MITHRGPAHGPAVCILARMGRALSEALAPVELPDAGGEKIRLGSLWERQPAVLVFLRHYG